MSNPLQGLMGGGQPNMAAMFSQFKNNPMQFLMQRKINIPQQYQNDPQGAVQYLMNSGQLTQDGFNKLSNMAQQMGLK
ncbi:MAG: hypothetical protein IJP94_01600 [Clostridia bacterium]|nr:hypothetical protein [Clostridia bacterium]MBQ3462090.1 hypothetical protein [Clostridia bacterium]MBQ9599416.1 hypothetical protein [Clostridia bacterium]MBR0088513.1 hypothetical protein [Clostridia bacterium]MBR0470996.1 hypothetical protein [Clostridia bacterium]